MLTLGCVEAFTSLRQVNHNERDDGGVDESSDVK